jgi:small subunit ribosomal protein S17
MSLKQKVGIVVSDKMDKSAVVAIDLKYKHNLYGKIMGKTKRYLIHDPENSCKIGETVLVQEHPPISAKKRWILKTVLK